MTCVGGRGIDIAEHMGVAPDQFAADPLGHLLDAEGPGFGSQRGVEHHLQQQVAQFLFHVGVGRMIGFPRRSVRWHRLDGVERLVGLLQQVLGQGVVGLLPIPRALRPQPVVGLHQPRPTRHVGVEEQRDPIAGVGSGRRSAIVVVSCTRSPSPPRESRTVIGVSSGSSRPRRSRTSIKHQAGIHLGDQGRAGAAAAVRGGRGRRAPGGPLASGSISRTSSAASMNDSPACTRTVDALLLGCAPAGAPRPARRPRRCPEPHRRPARRPPSPGLARRSARRPRRSPPSDS